MSNVGPQETSTTKNENKEANTCIGLGVGVGAFGVIGATVSGAVCPLCLVVAPALVGYGVYRRIKKGEKEHE